MDVTREIKVEFTTKEIEEILIEHLGRKGITVSSVYFHIGEHYDPTDWRSQYPPTHALDKIVCTGSENLN